MFPLDELREAFAPTYTIDAHLTADPLGQRLLARTSDNSPKIITVLDQELAAIISPESFLTSLRYSAHVRHPALLPIEHAERTRLGHTYYVMPYPSGLSARVRLEEGDVVSTAEIASIGEVLADALAALQVAGLIHGAISPETVYLAKSGPVLGDVGVSRALISAGATRDVLMTHVFRAPYASPEQLSGELADARSDVYGLGATLYELMTGKPPFGGRETSTTLASVLADETAEMVAYGVQVPGLVSSAVLRAIEKDPEDRWQTASELASALIRAERGEEPEVRKRLGCVPVAAGFGAIIAAVIVHYAI